MGIITRFTDIMSANINSILSENEAKNADKLLEKYLRDAQDDLKEVKSETATLMAQETSAKRKLDDCKEKCEKYAAYAQQAIVAGNDSDALKFLEAKKAESENLSDLEASLDRAQKSVQNMKQMTSKLISDIEDATLKLKELKSQLKLAEAMENAQELNQKMAGKGMGNFGNLADSLQARIDKANATMELNNEMQGEENDISDLMDKYTSGSSSAPSAMDELAALKAKMGKI